MLCIMTSVYFCIQQYCVLKSVNVPLRDIKVPPILSYYRKRTTVQELKVNQSPHSFIDLIETGLKHISLATWKRLTLPKDL